MEYLIENSKYEHFFVYHIEKVIILEPQSLKRKTNLDMATFT